ncbi:glutelin type-B 2-like [Phragmites australis]|uniref:glutelin type-B 2-like n=1 Tax=Phragmites australis TaxID=29695 RepID=UPI002D766360|nr:glutelin type-B 2-like [Phragmites australis]
MEANSFSIVSFWLCILLFSHGSVAQKFGQSMSPWQGPRQGGSRECRFDRLQAFESLRRVRSEAGVTEYFEEANEQFRCSGISAIRRVIEPQGLLLPQYTNTPGLVYIIQGNGIAGLTLPGCPETFQQQFQDYEQSEFSEGQRQTQKFRDEHQEVHRFTQGDVIALPAGVAHWLYNDGDAPVVAIFVYDINNSANQLEPRQKQMMGWAFNCCALCGKIFNCFYLIYTNFQEFALAGNNRRQQQTSEGAVEQHTGQNIFNGFNVELLSEAFSISREMAHKLQSQNDQRGEIVRVPDGLQLLRPTAIPQRQEQETYQRIQYQQGQSSRSQYNGLEENFCTLEAKLNIEDPNRADTYNPRAGRITRLNSQKLPILNMVQMSATRVNLYQNALLSPFWNINAHSVVYMIQGQARIQVVNDQGRTVFSGVVRRGQLLIIPQNYAVVKKAMREGCQYIAFKTNANSMVSHIAGKNSILRALPVDVIAIAYRISREEARNLKNNRGQELGAFAPRYDQSSYQIRANEDDTSSVVEPSK